MIKNNELDLTPLGLRLALAAGASALALGAAQAWAQDDEDQVDLIEESEIEETQDEIVVTGSRIKRSTFTSISPLQVISASDSLDVGLIDPASILQNSEAAAGQQIDATFQGFVLDNGPGSQTLNLRGLGADRTLLLVNGRRFAPSGVEGAPSNPSINLLPASLIERYDLLLDGASSVYGSDAVAGVGNIILKKDFDGLELFGSGNINQAGAGHDYAVSAAWGKNTDRGFIGVGAEYAFQDEVTFADRDFLAGCDTNLEITESGQIRTVDIADNAITQDRSDGAISQSESPCKIDGIVGRIFSPFQTLGSIYFTPGQTNTGIPNFSESTLPGGIPVDADGDGVRDVDFRDFNLNGQNLDRSLFFQQKRFSASAYGEYTFDGEMNITPFFEVLYSQVDIESDSGASQFFPTVPGSNPFNPCNIAAGGTDCAAAEVNLLGRPGANAGFSLPVQPIVSVVGDRENADLTIAQTRLVGGFRGDLPMLNFGSLDGWSFEASGVYSFSDSSSVREGIREDRLAASLGIDPTDDADGNGIYDDYDANDGFPTLLAGGACDFTDVAQPELLTADVTDGCVPVNLFTPDLLGNVVGDLSAAERAYVFGERSFDTTYEQIVLNAFITGTIFDLPAGPVGLVLGGEYRRDEVDSQPNNIASNGLFFGFAADQGAVGSKDIKEGFVEVDLPLLGDKPFARELSVQASARWSEEEFYGAAWTYSTKVGWRPIDPLLLKASFGTSFRAPNLRENFLAGRTGFNNIVDPCAVPEDAIDANGNFDGSGGLDTREQTTIANCIREGRDPFRVGIDPTLVNVDRTAGVEIETGGTLDLLPETSESFTAGFAFEQPFFDSFDLNVNVNYYDIEIEGAVVSPGAQFIVNDCFTRVSGGRSPFCDRILFDDPNDASSPRGLISDINAGFINQDLETVTGLDYNAFFAYDFDALDQPMTFRVNLRANQLLERDNVFVGDDGQVDRDQFAGEFGFPEWTSTTTASLEVDKYLFTWQMRYIGEVSQDEEFVDPFSDALDTQGTGFVGDTCLGPDFGDELCRDVGFADPYAVHTASLRYRGDTVTVRAGITNVFDRDPPLVDSNEIFAVSNTPIGNGYNLDGREFFFVVNKEF